VEAWRKNCIIKQPGLNQATCIYPIGLLTHLHFLVSFGKTKNNMKKNIIFTVLFLIAARLSAQDCSQYMYMKKNNTIEETLWVGGQLRGKTVFFIAGVSTANGTTTSTGVVSTYNENGKLIDKNNVSFKCTGGAFIEDLSTSGSQSNMKYTSGGVVTYPANMKVGQHFDDVNAEMEMDFGGKTKKANAKYTDRTVADKETITTPAGSWTCFRITYNFITTITQMSMPPMTVKATEWYVPNLGVVQTQFGSFIMKVTSIKGS
jgi:hypothetical protein